MKHRIFVIILICFGLACKNKNSIPGNVLPQKKMQLVLWDMMRADQFLQDYVLNHDTIKKKIPESLKYYQQIFAIHKISKDDFDRSFDFYRSKPALFKAIMDSISAPGNEAPTKPIEAVPSDTIPSTVKTNPDTPATAVTPSRGRTDSNLKRIQRKELPQLQY